MRKCGCVPFLALLTLMQVSARGEVPSTINYQGRLLDAGGNPLTTNVTVAVALYTNDTAGATVYGEAVGVVSVVNGLYSFHFGNHASAMKAALLNDECWLEVSIDGAPLSPRHRLMAVPYAIRSAELEHLGSNTTFAADVVPGSALVDASVGVTKLEAGVDARYVNASGDTVQGTLTVEDNLGVGTNSPTSPLHVVGGDSPGEFVMKIYAGSHRVAWAKRK